MLKIKDKLKHFFDYKKRFKNQKHKNKRLKKKINKITSSLMSELKLDITNEEIAKLKREIISLKKQLTKSNLEAQKYFDLLMDELHKEKADLVESE